MTIKGQKDIINQIFAEIEGIKEIEFHDSAEKDCMNVIVKCAENVDIREEIFYKLSDKKCPIMMMKTSNMSLKYIIVGLFYFFALQKEHASSKEVLILKIKM